MGEEHQQEQDQEIEVLESIYPDELTRISPNEYSISVALDLPDDMKKERDEEDEEEEEAPKINIYVKYPETYPDVAPTINLTLPPPPHPLSFPSDLPPIESALETAIEENMGMAMVFSLVTTIKEAAETILQERAQAARAAREEEIRVAEEKEMEKFRGEIVTREVFLKWREGFQKEMREKKEREEKEREDAEKGKKSGANTSGFGWINGRKMTGRELFEKGLVGGLADEDDIDDDGAEDEEIAGEVEKLKVEAA